VILATRKKHVTHECSSWSLHISEQKKNN